VVGDLASPQELLRAAYRAGVTDLHAFLHLHSLAGGARVGGNTAGMAAWAALAGEHGVVVSDIPPPPAAQGGGRGPPQPADAAVQRPADAVPPRCTQLAPALSIVRETLEEEGGAEEEGGDGAAGPQAVAGTAGAYPGGPAAFLAESAACGLVPRPGGGAHVFK
jgi:hypothetical protein